MSSAFKRYVLPGIVFQSVVIGGGYGTGRELVEFFLTNGPVGGLLGMLISTAIWSIVCVTTFEFARLFEAHDYRSFFRELLGRSWVLFEICYLIQVLVALAVMAAAAGAILNELFGLPSFVGVLGITAAVATLAFRGSAVIERAFAWWSFVLYAVYAVFFTWCLVTFREAIVTTLSSSAPQSGWVLGGVKYATYNLGIIPAVLFVVRHAQARRDTVVAGLLCGPIAIAPACLFLIAMFGLYPAVLDRPVPANMLLEVLGSRGFQLVFQFVLFGTLVESGTGMIHAVNERLASLFTDRGQAMPPFLRPAVALAFLALGIGLAQVGLIGLIAKGYGTLAWLFLATFVVPLLTIGLWKIATAYRRAGNTG